MEPFDDPVDAGERPALLKIEEAARLLTIGRSLPTGSRTSISPPAARRVCR
jgi:hypothetical protein